MEYPTIQNIVSTVNSNCVLDLKKIAKCALNVEYQPMRFGALIMRIRQPRCTALIFNSGKIVVAGCKNIADAKNSCYKFVKILYKLSFKVTFKDFKIQNIVCSYDMKSNLFLEKIHLYCENLSCFEPELFPGLILRIEKTTFLIFSSGKVVITGINNYDTINKIFKTIYLILIKFKKVV